MILFAIVASMTCLFVVASVKAHARARRATNVSWNGLMAKIQSVDSVAIATIALDHLAPTKNQLELKPDAIWQMIGGLKGLQRMKDNADVLIAFAVFAERWNFHEGVIVAERMRRDGLALRRAVRSIERGLFLKNILNMRMIRLAFDLHDAAASYYLMRQRLLALYETSHGRLHPYLAQAL